MCDAGQFRVINSTIARVLVVHRILITLSAEAITNLPQRGRTKFLTSRRLMAVQTYSYLVGCCEA